MDNFIKGISQVSRLCGIIASALIAISVGVVCQMVIVRYFLNQTTIWQTDFVTYSLVAATFIGSPYLALTRGHVNVDVLPLYFGPKGRFILAMFAFAIAIGFALVMTILTAQFWHEAWDNNWRSDSMWRARLWIPYMAMPIGLALVTLQYFAELLKVATGREHPFGLAPKETAEEAARAMAQDALGGTP